MHVFLGSEYHIALHAGTSNQSTVSDSVQTHKGSGSGKDLDGEILNYVYTGNCFMILNKINQVQTGVRGEGGRER